MKTIAYEIVEQLGWRAPDWYIQSVSGGLGPLGVYQGFKELYSMGLIERIPKLAVIQAEGCAPMVKAFKAGQEVAEAVIPDTHIIVLSTGDPGKMYTYLWKLIQAYGGVMESVSDAEAFSAMRSARRPDRFSPFMFLSLIFLSSRPGRRLAGCDLDTTPPSK